MTNYSIKNGRLYLYWDNEVAYFDANMLSDATGINIKTAYKWLNGTHKPDETKLKLLLYETFGICPRYPEYRIMDGYLFHKTVPRPFPLSSIPLYEATWSANERNKYELTQLKQELASLSSENRALKQHLDGFLLQLVKEADSLDIAVALRDYTQNRLPNGL